MGTFSNRLQEREQIAQGDGSFFRRLQEREAERQAAGTPSAVVVSPQASARETAQKKDNHEVYHQVVEDVAARNAAELAAQDTAFQSYTAAKEALDEFNHTPTWELRAQGVDVETRQKQLQAAVDAAKAKMDAAGVDTRNSLENVGRSALGGFMSAGKGIVNELGYLAQLTAKSEVLLDADRQAAQAALDAHLTGDQSLVTAAEARREQALRDYNAPMKAAVNWGDAFNAETAERTKYVTGAGKVVNDVAAGVGGMVPSIAANLALPGSGLYVLFTQAAGNAAEEALNAGYSNERALGYGVAVGGIEVLTEKMFGGIPGLNVGAVDDLVENAVKSKLKSSAAQRAALLLMDALGEGFEEFASEFGDKLASDLLLPGYDARSWGETLGDAGYSFLVGALTSAVMQIPTETIKRMSPKQAADVLAAQVEQQIQTAPSANAEALQSVQTGTDTTATQNAAESTVAPQTAQDVQTVGNLPARTDPLMRDIQRMNQQQAAPAAGDPLIADIQRQGQAQLTSAGNIARYQADIDRVFTGTYPSGQVIRMGNTPEILTRYGASDRPLTITQSTLYKIAYPEGYMGGKHNLGMSVLKQLPYQIADPVAILQSTSQLHSLVILTEWKDGSRDIIVPVHLDKQGALELENNVASAYGTGHVSTYIGENAQNVLYTKNGEDIYQLLSKGVQFPQAMADDVLARNDFLNRSDIDTTIPQGAESVKTGENHIDNRSMADVGDRRVNAFSFDHPELHGYFAEAAQTLLNDAENSATNRGWTYSRRRGGDGKKVGREYVQQSSTLLDAARAEGYSLPEIMDAAQRIINDSGQENVAAAKRVEIILDDMLTNGYSTSYGERIAPNADYISAKAAIPGGSSEAELRIRQMEESYELTDALDPPTDAELARREAEKAKIRARYAPTEQTSGLPRGTGAAEAGFSTYTQGEQVPTQNNTVTQSPFLTEDEKERFAPGTHERVTEAMSMERASKLLYTDTEGRINPDETLAGLLEKEVWTGAEQDAAQMLMRNLISEARQTGDFSKAETLRKAIERIGGTEAGRSLQARVKWINFLRSLTPEGRLFMIERSVDSYNKQRSQNLENRIEKRKSKGKSTEKLEQRLGDLRSGDIKLSEKLKYNFLHAASEEARDAVIDEMQKDVAAQLPTTALEKWNALRYVNMLGNFKTQIRNLSGNVVMQGITRAKDAVATGIESIASKLSGGKIERTKALNPGKELKAAARADFQTVKDIAAGESKYSINENRNDAVNFMKGAQEQKTVFKLGDNALTRKLGVANKKGLINWTYGDNAVTEKLGIAGKEGGIGIDRTLEAYRKLTDFMMNNGVFGDVAFLRASYTHALAGYLKAHNISAEQFSSSDWRSNNADFVDTARAYAIKEAQEATFRDTNTVSKWVSQIARKDSTPGPIRVAGEGLAPFRKTPANVAVRAEEYSLLGFVNTAVMAVQKARGNENITGADIINQFSKAFTGTGIMVLGMWLESIGWLRTKEDDDDQEYFDRLTGHQDYALELPGGFSYTLDWLTPAAMPLFMGAELMKAIQEGGLSAGDLLSALGAGAEAFWDPMLEMSMLSGINDTLESISYSSNKWGRLAVQLGLSYLTQGLSNTLLGQLERISEPNRMSTFTNKDEEAGIIPTWLQYELGRLSAKTPGWDYRQREYTDAWGETQSNGDLFTRILINGFSPGYVSHVEMNDTEKELQRVTDQTGDTSVFPDTAAKEFTVDGKKVYFTKDEYTEFSKALGEYRREVSTDILLSPLYKRSKDVDKADIWERGFKYAYQLAKSDALDDDDVINKWAVYARDARRDLGISTADYLYYVDEYGADVTSNNHDKAVAAHRRGMDAGNFFSYASGRMGSDANGSGGLDIQEQAASIDSAKRKLGLSDRDTETLWLVYNDTWEEKAKDAGVSNGVYIDFRVATAGLESDKDANGKIIRNSLRDKVAAVINEMDLTIDEKDGLYYAAGYSEKNIGEMPWHR